MKIISWNVNGIRAAYKKGFLAWLLKAKPDIVCLQEIKAREEQIPEEILKLPGYFTYFNSAEKPGYSGTAVFCKEEPSVVENAIGESRFDKEGRVLKLEFKNFTLLNLYMINGGGNSESRAKTNMADKLASYDYLLNFLNIANGMDGAKLRPKTRGARTRLSDGADGASLRPTLRSGARVILTGDFNVAHKDIDLARPKENKKNHGFTLPEREKIDTLLGLGFVDSFRQFYPQKTGAYTWWTHWANARQRNVGWRIDYCFVSSALASKLKKAFIFSEVMSSDHCPVGVDIDL